METTTPKAHLFALLRAAGHVEAEVESRLNRGGLSIPKLAALHQLVNAGVALPLGQLAERLSCVKSNVTQLVDRLEADGFVERAPDPADRRARLAVITDAGRRAYEQGKQIQQEAERELFGVLSPAESTQFLDLIKKLERRA
jgi:DNA-binding MarR family transcriptional regulator